MPIHLGSYYLEFSGNSGVIWEYCIMFFTDLLPQMRSPELAHLLPGVTTALAISTATSTSKSYVSHFKKWKLWCAQFPEVNDFPVYT